MTINGISVSSLLFSSFLLQEEASLGGLQLPDYPGVSWMRSESFGIIDKQWSSLKAILHTS